MYFYGQCVGKVGYGFRLCGWCIQLEGICQHVKGFPAVVADVMQL